MMSAIKNLASILSFINRHPLAGRHRLKAYTRFLSWQLQQLISPGIKTVPFINDAVLMVDKAMKGATGNVYLGLHDFEDMGFLLHFLRESDLFVDVGANVGSYSVLAAKNCQAECVSFEPIPETFASLQRNINKNGVSSIVTLVNKGIGSGPSQLYFTTSFDCVNHVVDEKSITDFSSVTRVEVDSLDNILPNPKKLVLIKIDVEGFETEVLAGMKNLLHKKNLVALIIELNGSGARYGYSEKDIHKKILDHGFLPYSYDPFSRSLELQTHFGNFNTIYLRDVALIRERLRTAHAFRVFGEKI